MIIVGSHHRLRDTVLCVCVYPTITVIDEKWMVLIV